MHKPLKWLFAKTKKIHSHDFYDGCIFQLLWRFADGCNFAAIKGKHLLNQKNLYIMKNKVQDVCI